MNASEYFILIGELLLSDILKSSPKFFAIFMSVYIVLYS